MMTDVRVSPGPSAYNPPAAVQASPPPPSNSVSAALTTTSTGKEPASSSVASGRESENGDAIPTPTKTGKERKRKIDVEKRDEANVEADKSVNGGSQTSNMTGEKETDADSASTEILKPNSATDSSKRRKITRMVREPEGPPDPNEVLIGNLCDHLNIPQNRDFNENLSLAKKQEAGRLLKELLEVVSDGALIPLMHVTLDNANVKKLAELKNVLISLLAEKLGLNDGRSFHVLSQNEEKNAGDQLRALVRGVAGDAVVPLMNATLSKDEVMKLCCLKGIQGSDLETATSNDTEEDDEDSDVDENMALAIRYMQAQNVQQGDTTLETEQRNENDLAESNIQPKGSNHGAASNPNTNQRSNEEEQPTAGSSSPTEGDRARARVAQSDPALKTELMKLGMNLQKQIMDFICEKCD